MKTNWLQETGSYEMDDEHTDLFKVQVEISKFEFGEIGFTKSFFINHFGFESKNFYDSLEQQKNNSKMKVR